MHQISVFGGRLVTFRPSNTATAKGAVTDMPPGVRSASTVSGGAGCWTPLIRVGWPKRPCAVHQIRFVCPTRSS